MNLLLTRSALSQAALIATLLLSAGHTHAVATATTTDDAGLQGDLVTPSLDVGFSPDLPLFAFDLSLQFDSAALTWQESGSTLTLNTTTYSFSDIAALLVPGITFSLDMSAAPTLSVLISAVPSAALTLTSLNFTPQFQINPTALPGVSTVVFSGTFVEDNMTLTEHVIEKTAAIQISAVPEPTTWLLLMAGLSVVGAAARGQRPTCGQAGAGKSQA